MAISHNGYADADIGSDIKVSIVIRGTSGDVLQSWYRVLRTVYWAAKCTPTGKRALAPPVVLRTKVGTEFKHQFKIANLCGTDTLRDNPQLEQLRPRHG